MAGVSCGQLILIVSKTFFPMLSRASRINLGDLSARTRTLGEDLVTVARTKPWSWRQHGARKDANRRRSRAVYSVLYAPVLPRWRAEVFGEVVRADERSMLREK